MSICPKCGAPLKPGARECENCRAEVTALGAQAVASATAAPGGDPAEPDDPALIGLQKSLGSLFKIERRLSRGGMADVYQAMEINPPRPVALKVLPPGLGVGEAAARFKREAQLAMALNHPNIVPVYRVGLRPAGCFFAMKLIEGRDLAQIVRAQGALPLPASLVVLRAATAALAYAHGRGTLHGDLEGANILVDHDGRVMVSDFGIARAVGDQRPASAGPQRFVSPEQTAGNPPGPPSDQYCLGMVALLMLTGSAPSDAGAAANVRNLLAAREGLPGGLVHIVQTALAQDPAQRYAGTADMLAAIKTIPFSDTDRQEAYAVLGQLARGEAVPKIRVAAPPQAPAARTAAPRTPTAPPAPKVAPPPAPKPAAVTEVAPAVQVPSPAPDAPAAKAPPPPPAPPARATPVPPPLERAVPPTRAVPMMEVEPEPEPAPPPPPRQRVVPPTRVEPALPEMEPAAPEPEAAPPARKSGAAPPRKSGPGKAPWLESAAGEAEPAAGASASSSGASAAARASGPMRRPRSAPAMSIEHGLVGVTEKKRSPLVPILAAVVVLAAIGGGAYWYLVLRPKAAQPLVQAPAPTVPARPAAPAPAAAESARADTSKKPATPATTAAKPAADTSGGGETTGQLLMSVVPAVADIRIDGNSTGASGFLDTEMTPGQHYVQISYPGYETLDTMINVRIGRTLDLGRLSLQSSGEAPAGGTGKLRLRTVPATAQIFVDGQAVGVGTLLDYEVAAGQRQIKVSAPGYADLDTTITVAAGATVRLGELALKSSP